MRGKVAKALRTIAKRQSKEQNLPEFDGKYVTQGRYNGRTFILKPCVRKNYKLLKSMY